MWGCSSFSPLAKLLGDFSQTPHNPANPVVTLPSEKRLSQSSAATGLVSDPWSVVHGSSPLHTSSLPIAAGRGRFGYVRYARRAFPDRGRSSGQKA
jgi:hypothetical protein